MEQLWAAHLESLGKASPCPPSLSAGKSGNSEAEITVWLTPGAQGGDTGRQELLRSCGKEMLPETEESLLRWECKHGMRAGFVANKGRGNIPDAKSSSLPSSSREHSQGCWKCSSLGWMEELWRSGNKTLDKWCSLSLQSGQAHPLQAACVAVKENKYLLM